ncbi:unnamed protein product [Clavelina lepadiformis]|uniref:Uncharacterized protein n=1 Tax=Clavelina lepadiformis TaxID=159417 RepID=A0ABP0GR30_CLALP
MLKYDDCADRIEMYMRIINGDSNENKEKTLTRHFHGIASEYTAKFKKDGKDCLIKGHEDDFAEALSKDRTSSSFV